jgi:hypothetical protein
VPPLQGLKGLYKDPQDLTDVMDEGVLEAKANTLNPEHSQYGAQHLGYSGPVPVESPFGPMSVYDGYSAGDSAMYGGLGFPVPGEETDQTPTTHVSPYPRGIIQPSWGNPDAYADAGIQMMELHGPELGGTRFMVGRSPAGEEERTHYTTDDYVAPNESYLQPLSGQSKAGGSNAGNGRGSGNADTVQGYGVLNTLEEFNAGHSIRRVQHDRMPWDFTATHGEQEVPFWGRHPVEQMPLDGPDSPYFEMGAIDGANTPWEGRIGYPTPYVQPSEPTIVQSSPSQDVWAWGGGF